MRGKVLWIATNCSVAIFLLTLMPPANARNHFKTIHRFKGKDGAYPTDALVSDVNGNLYGTTEYFGPSGSGAVFELTPNASGTWSETVLHKFGVNDGWYPKAGLLRDASGNLFGTTSNGGADRRGTVFELIPNKDGSWSEVTLYSFKGGQDDGAGPQAGLISDANGNLFGVTVVGGATNNCTRGCGTVFELVPGIDNSWSEKVIHFFGGTDGVFPFGTLIFDAKGRLYGTTEQGGQYNFGTAFQLVHNYDDTWSEIVLHSFNLDDGSEPDAGLILDGQGTLYGTTKWGGTHGVGVTFELVPDGDGGWNERILHSFQNNGIDGLNPVASLVFDNSGNLYGTTPYGGAFDFGTVFRLKPIVGGHWRETVVHTFRNQPGCRPLAGLLVNPRGSLFGTTYGCSITQGSVFELTP